MSASLDTLQNLFQAYLMEGYRDIEAHIVPQAIDKITIAERLNIYRHAYYARLAETLEMDYPKVAKLLGAKRFSKLAHAYVEAYPSHHFSIRLFGRHFAEFLAQHQAAEPPHAELALLEWALSQVLDAPDGSHLLFTELAQISPEAWADMRLAFHPSVSIILCFYNITAVWRALQQGQRKPRWRCEKKLQACLVWRYEQRPYFMEMSDLEYTFYQAICQGKTFMEACNALATELAEEEIPLFTSATLQKWIQHGILAKAQVALVNEVQTAELTNH